MPLVSTGTLVVKLWLIVVIFIWSVGWVESSTLQNTGERVRFLRLKKRMSQERLGELCNVTQQAIGKLERNVTAPKKLLSKVAEALGTSVEYLAFGVGETPVLDVEKSGIDPEAFALAIKRSIASAQELGWFEITEHFDIEGLVSDVSYQYAELTGENPMALSTLARMAIKNDKKTG